MRIDKSRCTQANLRRRAQTRLRRLPFKRCAFFVLRVCFILGLCGIFVSPALALGVSPQTPLAGVQSTEHPAPGFSSINSEDLAQSGTSPDDRVGEPTSELVVHEGESDDSRFIHAFAHVPEPMVYDLVRGLNAEAGELEVNTLVLTNIRKGRSPILWAPEVEWAFLDGYAFEFELPMVDRRLEALKFALQGRLPGSNDVFVHGWQLLAEHIMGDLTEGSLKYLVGGTLGDGWSLFAMVGGRTGIRNRGLEHGEILFNPSVFCEVSSTVTLGFETNVAIHPSASPEGSVLAMPQIHWQISDRVRLQGGAGATFDFDGTVLPTIAFRAIIE